MSSLSSNTNNHYQTHYRPTSSFNKTNADSLTNIIIHKDSIPLPPPTTTTSTTKNTIFYQALQLIQTHKRYTNVSEFSLCNSKDEKVLTYIHNPITKTIFKDGNNIIKVNSPRKTTEQRVMASQYKVNKLLNNLMHNIIEIEDDDDDVHVHDSDNNMMITVKKEKRNVEGKESTNANSVCNRLSNDMVEIVNDLDEERDVDIKEYYVRKNERGVKDDCVKEVIEGEERVFKGIEEFDEGEEKEKIYIVDEIKDNVNEESSVGKQLVFNNNDGGDSDDSNVSDSDSNNNNSIVKQLEFITETNSLLSSTSYTNAYSTPTKHRKVFQILFNTHNNNSVNINTNKYNITHNHKHIKSHQYKDISLLLSHSHTHTQTKSLSSFLSLNILPHTHLPSTPTLSNYDDAGNIFNSTFLNNLLHHNTTYLHSPSLILSNKPSLTPTSLAKVYTSIMHICEEFAYKRDTYYLCITNTEHYLSTQQSSDISLKQLHLIMLTCLELSAKIEEVQIPKLSEYTTLFPSYSFTVSDITQTEQHILTHIGWRAIPNTMNMWLSWHVCQWDLFIDTVEGVRDDIQGDVVYFKKKDDAAYYNYRKVTQVVDLFSIDMESRKFDVQYLVVCAIWVVLGDEREDMYMNVFRRFVEESFGDGVYDSEEFKEVMEYCGKMKGMEFTFELPLVYQVNDNDNEDDKGSYEEFITYMTVNESILEFMLNKKRLI